MRNRLTKQAMGLNDSPTTMHVEQKNPDVSKYETGDPSAWGEDVSEESPWDLENAKGREETGHAKKVRESHTYASMVKEAKELENKALHCLKMAEVLLGEDAPADVIERQAVDFMTMSNKSVLSSLRRMREFEDQISETRVAKIVDAVLEVIAEEDEEEKKAEKEEVEKKATSEDEDAKIASIVEAVLQVIAEEKEEEEKKAEKEEVKEAAKEEEKMAEKEEEKKAEEKEEMKEAAKEEKEEEKMAEKEEEKMAEKEEMKHEASESSSMNVSFDEGADVIASEEDVALLAQLFSTKEASEDLDQKDAKIKTLKNVTASSSSEDEISKLASLWSKDF